MADFRKWLTAFAVITLLLGFGATVFADVTVTAPITCTATNGTPRQVRVEGVSELVGDVVLNCTGGIPTTAGQPVPLANIRVALSSPITTRNLSTKTQTASEAMLTIDEPYPVTPFPNIPGLNGAPPVQIGCLADGGQTNANPYLGTATVGVCDIAGVAVHSTTAGTYFAQYNTFQGSVTNGGQYIDFLGVPVDAPGTNFTRIIRITNLRADATKVPLGQTITATVSVSGNASLTVQSPYTTVAFVYQGFLTGKVTSQNEVQCAAPGAKDQVGVTFSEGFATSFKTALITDADGIGAKGVNGLNSLRNDSAGTGWEWQDVIGTPINYYTESGFTPSAMETADTKSNLVGADTKTPVAGDGSIGVADYGTRFKISINNLQNGINLTFLPQVAGGTGGPNLLLQLIAKPNADGTGGTWATGNYVSAGSWTPTSGSTTDFVVYEVVADDPNLQESVTIPAAVSYSKSAINLGANIPALGASSSTSTSTITASFAPIAADTPGQSLIGGAPNSSTVGSLPRFIVSQSPLAAVILNPCSCNLLYPWIVSGSGFDTGMVVVNTSVSPTTFAAAPTSQSGTVTLWFTGTRSGASVQNEFHPNAANTPSEPAINVPAGCAFALIMSLGSSVNCVPVPAGNGSISTAVTTGFVGYIIATTTFQYCHGVAYVSPQNNPFAGSYYEALQLDVPGIWRTGQTGENVGH